LSRFRAVRRVLVRILLALIEFQLLVPALSYPIATGSLGVGHSDRIVVGISNRPPGVFDFAMFAGPSELTVAQGSTANTTLWLWSPDRFSGTVQLSVTPSPGLFASVNPLQVSLRPGESSASTLTVFPPVKLIPEAYSVEVNGVSGSKSHAVTVKVTVTPRPNFVLSVIPESLQVDVGGSTTATLDIVFQNGPMEPVDLTVIAPDGIIATLDPSRLEGSGTSTLKITAASTVAPGSYSIRVDVVQGFLTRSHMFLLAVTAPGASRVPALYASQTALIIGGSVALFAAIVWGLFVAPRRREKSKTKYRYGTPTPAQS
jgi:hypothetical protein